MGWSKVTMPADSAIEGYRLQTQFDAIWITALAPEDAALFKSGDVHSRYTFYFSPKATQIFSTFISAFLPAECSPPTQGTVSLLVGHANAWSMLPS